MWHVKNCGNFPVGSYVHPFKCLATFFSAHPHIFNPGFAPILPSKEFEILGFRGDSKPVSGWVPWVCINHGPSTSQPAAPLRPFGNLVYKTLVGGEGWFLNIYNPSLQRASLQLGKDVGSVVSWTARGPMNWGSLCLWMQCGTQFGTPRGWDAWTMLDRWLGGKIPHLVRGLCKIAGLKIYEHLRFLDV